jgi:hypothetical protein
MLLVVILGCLHLVCKVFPSNRGEVGSFPFSSAWASEIYYHVIRFYLCFDLFFNRVFLIFRRGIDFIIFSISVLLIFKE